MLFHLHVLGLQLLEKLESQFLLLQDLCVPYSSYPHQNRSIAARPQEKKINQKMLFRWTFHYFFPFPGYNLGAWRGNGGMHNSTRAWGQLTWDTTDRNHRLDIHKMVGLVIVLNWPVLYLTSLDNCEVSTICSWADMEVGRSILSPEFQSRDVSNSPALVLGRGHVKDESRCSIPHQFL